MLFGERMTSMLRTSHSQGVTAFGLKSNIEDQIFFKKHAEKLRNYITTKY